MVDQPRYRVIIVDPDLEAGQRIADIIEHYKDFLVLDILCDPHESIRQIQAKQPEMIFLETEVKDMSGFDLLKHIYPVASPQFVFTTSDKDQALKAFEYFAFDYIVKPYPNERLHLTLLKARERLSNKDSDAIKDKLNALYSYISAGSAEKYNTNGAPPDTHINLIPVKMGGRIYFLKTIDIEYIVASGYYIEIYAKGKKHLLRESLRGIINKLDRGNFVRIHRSVIISLRHLKEISRQGASDFGVRMEDGSSFKISKSYKTEVFEHIGIG